jgi:hypothetical protein
MLDIFEIHAAFTALITTSIFYLPEIIEGKLLCS